MQAGLRANGAPRGRRSLARPPLPPRRGSSHVRAPVHSPPGYRAFPHPLFPRTPRRAVAPSSANRGGGMPPDAVALVCQDAALTADVRRLCAAVGQDVHVITDQADMRRLRRRLAVLLVDATAPDFS